MKKTLQTRLRRLWGEDVFSRTQSRLTLMYSGVLMLFLAIFIVLVYGLLYYIIFQGQDSETQLMADQQELAVREYLKDHRTLDPVSLQSEGVLGASEDQLFSYIVDPGGRLIYGRETAPDMREGLLTLLRQDPAAPAATRNVKLRVSSSRGAEERPAVRAGGVRPGDKHWEGDPRLPRGYRPPLGSADGVEMRLLVASRPLVQGDRQIGTLYVGKNISYPYELISWLLIVFAGLGVLFFGLALYMSRRMSKRAMIPVMASYQRQREFVADASHELRTPLSVLLSSIDALEMEQAEEPDPFVRRLLANMKDEVRRMSGLTSDLLTLARSDTPEYRVAAEAFDLQPHAARIVETLQPLAEAKKIRLEGVMPSPLPVTADAEKLQQLLYILLDNAVKYTPDGGGVTLRLSVQGTGASRKLTMMVEDTGIGMDAGEQARVFDRFYRADQARTRQTGGHGLGLAIARQIVDAHHGSIRLASVPGEGTVFTVTIPAGPG